MLKFRDSLEETLFRSEYDCLDREIDEATYTTFIKRRRPLVGKLKDFKKSQQSKASWRRNRFKHMRGIRKWSSSLASKKFHRKLGRFLATRITRNNESVPENLNETLKALSSLCTHLYLENDYYFRTADDQAEFENILEYSVPLIRSLENKILFESYDSITNEELELVARLTDESEILLELSNLTGLTFSSLSLNENEESESYCYLEAYSKLVNNEELLTQIKNEYIEERLT